MRNSDTGEFELVVGNRQLLSGFFIVILLLAVTFAMGYVVGQYSPRTGKAQADAGRAPAGGMAENRPQPVSPVPAAITPTAAPSGQQAGGGTGTAPAESTTATVPASTAAGGGANPAPAASPAPASSASQAPTGPVTDLPPGSYWQVMAVGPADAEVVVRTLKDMGLPALMSPAPSSPNRGSLMRVLVGPYNDTETMGGAKSQLENAGFHPIKK